MIRRSTAFTLIELLVVVAIIAILAAIGLPNLLEAQMRSKVSRAKADLRSLATAVESYMVDQGRYMPYWVPVGLGGETLAEGQQVKLLTTPIAYIVSLPPDAFQEAQPVTSPNPEKNYQPQVGPFPRYFVFTNQYVPQGSRLVDGRGGWVLRSMGPDLDFDLVDDPADNDTAFLGNGVYDPTNGTVASGDIVRSGGDLELHRDD
ncbi:MAG: prepilin-type N-terminal cleavage/methylation domain-containing protein [Candidatus Sumerlaeia bacterium]|nr:prepilin-type N-terminal cleavage/methylation domain-containing protein [Candidatus Sumerlaeia bacterium]